MESGYIQARRRHRLGRIHKQQLRDKCLHALKRRHWEAILDIAREHPKPESTQCFGTYNGSKECPEWLRKQDPACQACVIVTKLLEVME